MATVKDVIAYICQKYPCRCTLTVTRLTMIMYIADCVAHAENGEQISDGIWKIDQFGPATKCILRAVKANKDIFQLGAATDAFGADHHTVSLLKEQIDFPSFLERDKIILDNVITEAYQLNWGVLVNWVEAVSPLPDMERTYQFPVAVLKAAG
jgi:Protein of unknown function (DUF4065)